MYKKKYAFTLAEAIATLVFLGVIAALVLPNAYKNAVLRSHRTKLQKAATIYQNAIESMVIENDLPRDETIVNNWATRNNCEEIRFYLRVPPNVNNGCKFLSVSDIYWNFDPNEHFSLTNVLVSFENTAFNEATAESNENTAFIMSASFSPDGGLHVNDVSYEQNNPTKKYWHAKKIDCFLNNKICYAEDYAVKK